MNDSPKPGMGLWASEHAGGLVVFDSMTGRIFLCNDVASQIWLGLSEGLNRDAIVRRLSKTFEVEASRANHDVAAFISELGRRGLLPWRRR